MSLGKESKYDHSMKICTLKIFSLGEVEIFLQLLYIDVVEKFLGYKDRYITPICEEHHMVLIKW